MRHCRIRVVFSAMAIVLGTVCPHYWANLPYRHFPFDNRKAFSTSTANPTSQWPVELRPTTADLAYADGSRFEKLDLYLPTKARSPAPLARRDAGHAR